LSNDKYQNFQILEAGEKRDEDYSVDSRIVKGALVAVIAPHGGTIEPLTDTIADRVAGKDFSFYAFRALKPNSGLHITSSRFDEPSCLDMLATHDRAVSIHGWGAPGERVCIGGRDRDLISTLKTRITKAGIAVEDAVGRLRGSDPANIVNRCKSTHGVQLELTIAFRKNPSFVESFVQTIRSVLSQLKVMN
jgi:phage replication-related protein YjqB (UPF0714/DUF867 family)